MGCSPSMLINHRNNRNKDNGNLFSEDTLDPQPGDSDTKEKNHVCDYVHESIQVVKQKDSIVSTAGLSHLTTFPSTCKVIRVISDPSGLSTSGRMTPRNSSLGLTPEEGAFETCDINSSEQYPRLMAPQSRARVLLVFNKIDVVSETLVASCDRLQMNVCIARSLESATEAIQHPVSGGYQLVIVDGRMPKTLDPDLIARHVRSLRGMEYTVLVVVVKKNLFEKNDGVLFSLLDSGYDRCIPESTQTTVCATELLQIQHSLIRTQSIISTQQVLYMTIQQQQEATIITDASLQIQFANRAAECLFHTKADNLVNRPLSDIFITDCSDIQAQSQQRKEFNGEIIIRGSLIEMQNIHCRAVPVACMGRYVTHVILTLVAPAAITINTVASTKSVTPSTTISTNASIMGQLGDDVLATLPNPYQLQQRTEPRGSLHSLRRGSFDIRPLGSDALRRTSIAKLSTLPLEAPITKVISMLSQVQENCSYEESRLLDKVMDFLKREGLYNPQMKELRTDDPVATDLIGALLMQGPSTNVSSRRGSNDSVTRTTGRKSSVLAPLKTTKSTSIINGLLGYAMEWDFDIFRLEELSEHRPLLHLGMELFRRFEVFSSLNIDEMTCRSWFIVMEAHYQPLNTYHNSTHAADVMQATAVFLQQLSIKDDQLMDSIDEATALISAATHDIDHPGRSSAFLCNSDSSLAILYNDLCVLESHHAALTFKLTLCDEKVNLFKNLDRATYKRVRSIVVDMILATEMTRHFEHLAKFVSIFGAECDNVPAEPDDNQILIRRMLIKCADVSNPARPLVLCVEWAKRIAEEYFTQTDEEKRRSLPIVMPMFDRATCSIAKSQMGFIDYIIQDMLQVWDGFIDMPELIEHTQHNYAQWKTMEEQGIHTLNDIAANAQNFISYQKPILPNNIEE